MKFTFYEPATTLDPLCAMLIAEGAFDEAEEAGSRYESGCHRTRASEVNRDPAFPDRLGASPAELAELNFSYTY
jgi:hypothetical protein